MGIFDIFKKRNNASVPDREKIKIEMYEKNIMGYRDAQDRRDKMESLFYPYRQEVDRIEAAWAVISNLKDYNGENAKALESVCLANVQRYIELEDFRKQCGYDSDRYCPAYVRLAMLYEKQKEYQKGIDICVKAIRNGAYEDRTSGKMYGRLARMIKKSGIDVTDDIKKLTLLQ